MKDSLRLCTDGGGVCVFEESVLGRGSGYDTYVVHELCMYN